MARLRRGPALAYACEAANPGSSSQICPSEPGCARVKEGCVTFENPEFDQVAARHAQAGGVPVVMDRCIFVDRAAIQ